MGTLSTQSPLPFPTHAQMVVRALRGAFSELLTSVGADPHEPQAISRQIGVNKNLAWKISKIIQSNDPSVALEQMPGLSGVRIFLRAVEKAGAGQDMLDAARDAIDRYEKLIEIHSGDRATLEIMGSSLSPDGSRTRDEQHRKMFYQGASYIWGAQARVILKIGLVGPGESPDVLDFASLNALIDFRRLRPDLAWVMATRKSNYDDGSQMATSASEPIDTEYAEREGVPLIAEFCSQPPPKLRRVVDGLTTSFELVEGPVGNTGALTCVAGTIQRNVPGYTTVSDRTDYGEHSATCDTPAEVMIVDLFIHEQFAFAIPPKVKLRSLLPPANLRHHPDNHAYLPLSEKLQDLGKGPLPLATPDVPKYNQMIRKMFDRTGWQPSEFHGFRMRIAYPPCPTAVVLRYPLPAK